MNFKIIKSLVAVPMFEEFRRLIPIIFDDINVEK